MDRRERFTNPLVAVKALFDSHQADIWTALPGQYQGAGKGHQTANVQPSIKAKLKGKDGTWEDVQLPQCLDCPILWPGGGNFQLTFPLAQGDEGLIIFASRCIDAWWQSGGVQPQAELRMHDLSDGFFIPAQLSQSKAPSTTPSSNTVQLRSLDGASFIEMAGGNVVNIKASGGINLTGNVSITGTVHATGNVTSDVDVKAGAISLNSHHHTGVQSGGSVTGGPV